MKSHRILLLVLVALLFSAATSNAQQSKAQKLFQEGLYQMEGMGDYTKAIESFNRVVKEFPKEKPIAARALLYVGVCYEKLGKKEARKAYERVIREFPDQREVVAEARNRLSAFERSPELNPNMTFRILQVFTTQIGYPGLSPDGSWVAFPAADVNGKWDVYLMNTYGGESRRITSDSSGIIAAVDIFT